MACLFLSALGSHAPATAVISLTNIPSQFGTVTLGEHYKRIAVEGNDYDPYTTLFAGKKNPTSVIASLVGTGVDVEEEQPVAK